METRTAGYLFNFPATPVTSTLLRALRNLMCGVEYLSICTSLHATYVSFQYVMSLQQHGCVMFSAPTSHVTNVRPSRDSPHRAVISCQTPEYQCLWFQFYRASNFYCMAIAAEPSSPSRPPSVADWAAVSIAAALETRVTAAAAIVAFRTYPDQARQVTPGAALPFLSAACPGS